MNSSPPGSGANPDILNSPSPAKNPTRAYFLKEGPGHGSHRRLLREAGFNPAEELMTQFIVRTAKEANGLFRSVCGRYGHSRRDGDGVWVAVEQRFLPVVTQTLPLRNSPPPCSSPSQQAPDSPGDHISSGLLGMLSGEFGSPDSPPVSQKHSGARRRARGFPSANFLRSLSSPHPPQNHRKRPPEPVPEFGDDLLELLSGEFPASPTQRPPEDGLEPVLETIPENPPKKPRSGSPVEV